MIRTPKHQSIATPWGMSDYSKQWAPGIVFYGTPSHGGIHLDPERFAQLTKKFSFREFNGNTAWYEEDEDICAVIIAFFEELHAAGEVDGYGIWSAVSHVRTSAARERGYRWLDVLRFIDDENAGRTIREACERFYNDNWQNWRRGGLSSANGPGWIVYLSRLSGGPTRQVYMKDYPEKSIYTDEELAHLPADEPVLQRRV